MTIKLLDGLQTKLQAPMSKSDTAITLAETAYARFESFSDGDYTYLTVRENSNYEIIKVALDDDSYVVTRAVGDTGPFNFSKNACVAFEMNSAVVSDIIANGGTEPTLCAITAGDNIEITGDGCDKTISMTFPECDAIKVGTHSLVIKDGCLVDEALCADDCTLTDGTYSNATLTVRNGMICAIVPGDNPIYTQASCSCCSCSDSDAG